MNNPLLGVGIMQGNTMINPLRVSKGIIVWISDTSDNNFGGGNNFTKYLKESRCSCYE